MSNLVPFVGMIMAILAQSGSMVVIKVAMSNGMNKYVMVVYSMVLSTIIVLPFAFLIKRSERPPLTSSALCSFFLLALIISSAQITSYVGIELSSLLLFLPLPSLTSFQLLLSYLLCFSVIYWRNLRSQAKVLGTIVSISGALVVILYKGPPIFKTHSSVFLNAHQFSPQLNWILGGLFCASDSLLTFIWYIYQGSVTKKYPAVTVIVFFQMFFTTILSTVFALIAVRDPNAWKLKIDIGLLAILYQAIVATVIRYLLTTWCVQRAGPLFCAMFKPVAIIFTVLMDSTFLGDDFSLWKFDWCSYNRSGILCCAVGESL